jgi:hypothetical protein
VANISSFAPIKNNIFEDKEKMFLFWSLAIETLGEVVHNATHRHMCLLDNAEYCRRGYFYVHEELGVV